MSSGGLGAGGWGLGLWSSGELSALRDAVCVKAGIEGAVTESVEVWGFRIEPLLRKAAPAIVPVEGGAIGLLEIGGGWATLLRRDLGVSRVEMAELARVLCAPHAGPHRAVVGKTLDACGVSGKRRERAFDAMLRDRLRYTKVTTAETLRTPAGSSFARQLREAGVLRKAALLAGAHFAQYLLWIVAWYLLGRDALSGRLDPGWLAAWALALAALVPFRLATTWLQGAVAVAGGGLLRQRLLDGALQLEPEEVRQDGAGKFLGRAIETEAIESLALSGGLMAGLAAVELVLAALVLGAGAEPALQIPALAGWTAAAGWLAWRYYGSRKEWTSARLGMTHDLVERMTGHRTRLAQEAPEDRHTEEDRAAERYVRLAERMDRDGARLTGLMPRGWLLVAMLTMAPAFLGARPLGVELAVSMGAMLLAWQALRRFTAGLANLAGAAISWKQVAPLFHASARGSAEAKAVAAEAGEVVVDAKDLAFAYAGRGIRVLDGVDVQVRRGDRVLLEGESGGGKSTLVSLLTGLRTPDSGMLLAGGLDRATIGARAWRKRIASAPQFQENHVLSGPFAFNALMGRKWPANPDEMKEAEELCRELGLGPLLERMPGGMMQMVGETGWQLSQGERSRLFMARALLQNPELVVLDESFGALDPETLRLSLECVLRRVKTLMVVAHP
jgi:ATP-binding cassette subfamily B protein